MAATVCQRSMALVTLLFPFLAASIVGIMYGFTKWLLGEED
jgi:nitrate reductase NapE component